MKKVNVIRKIIISFQALIILIWAFFQNSVFGKIVLAPFLVCSFSILCEYIFLLLNKIKISNIFKYIFKVSLFTYIFGFLLYATYYSIINKEYSILIIVAIFLTFSVHFFRGAFKRK